VGCAPQFALMPLCSFFPHTSNSRVTGFELYLPSGYDLVLPESEYALVGTSSEFSNYRHRSGDYLFVDRRPSDDWSVRVTASYEHRKHIEFTLPVKRR
jgi:hypothetical protein